MVVACALAAQAPETATVIARPVSRTDDLPAEILPYLIVPVHAKLAGYVERVPVDRGSRVKRGDLLVELSAPELQAQIAEAESKVQAAESERIQADAQFSGARSTYERLKKASETPGAIAGNELVLSEKQVAAAQALVGAREQAVHAAQSSARAQKDLQAYLQITAPFDGVVTERSVHPGALVGRGSEGPLLVIQQVSRLRVVVPVPETDAGSILQGAQVSFRVPAAPERAYTGTVARISHVLDAKTRTMAVELEVANRDGSLAPGMYPTVAWPVHAGKPSLWVPRTSIVTTTERTFVIRNHDGRAEWIDVKTAASDGELVEVMGPLRPGDRVVRHGSDEIRAGTKF